MKPLCAISQPATNDDPFCRRYRTRACPAQSEGVPSYVWFYPGLALSMERELFAFLGTHNGVAMVEWPRDAGRIERLAQFGLPRLLLVHSVVGAPVDDGFLQDWVPSSATTDEIHMRLRRLCARAAERRMLAGRPSVDGRGRLSVGEGFINLVGPTETLARVLVTHFEEAVDPSTLARADPAFSSARRLEGWLSRLSELVNPVGLEAVGLPDRTAVMRWCRLAIRAPVATACTEHATCGLGRSNSRPRRDCGPLLPAP